MKNILLSILATTLLSCSYSHTTGGSDSTQVPQSGLNDGTDPVVSYADVDKAVFTTSCAGCHQKKGLDLSFADYANSKSFADEIQTRVFEDQDMPPRGGLTDVQLQVLRTWLDTGAPQ